MAASKARPAPANAPAEGRELSNYRLTERAAQDELATIYHAVHQTLDRPVDVHILRRSDWVSASRFQLTGRLGARLHHANILPVIDAGRDERYGDYMVTPRLSGKTLAEVLAQGPLEPLAALRIFTQVGAALDHIHREEIIHRDVRPGQISVTTQGAAYLMGFSLAAAPDAPDLSSIDDSDYATPYTAPEQRLGGKATPAQDIFSLGAVLYHMLHGEAPPGDPSAFKALAERDPQFAGADALIHRMLAREPGQRPVSAEQAAQVLRHAFRKLVDAATPDLHESRWEPGAEWLENPLEQVFGALIDPDFIAKSRARADLLHKSGQLRRVLDRWSRAGHLRRPALGELVQPEQIVSYNIYLYELRAYYETRTAPEVRELQATGVALGSRFNAKQDVWEVAVPDVEPFEAVKAETIIIPGSQELVPCPVCSGATQMPCRSCNGVGTVDKMRRVKADDGTSGEETVQEQCPNCRGYGKQPCANCNGNGRMLHEKVFSWSRSAKMHTNEDDIHGLNERAIRSHANEVFKGAIDPYEDRWYQVEPLRELLEAAIKDCGENTRLLASELTIRGVPVTEVDYQYKEKPHVLAIIGPPDSVTGDSMLMDVERILLYAVIAVLVLMMLGSFVYFAL